MATAALAQLTQAGDNTKPQWSPDGRWIAFVSERKNAKEDDAKEEEVAQLYLIPVGGGEAFPVTQGDEEVHSFSWSPDSRALYFATRTPWAKTQKDAYKKEWKDVLQYRAAERGDMIFTIDVADAIARRAAEGTKPEQDSEDESDATPGAHALARTPWRVHELEASPDGRKLAFARNRFLSARKRSASSRFIRSSWRTRLSIVRRDRSRTIRRRNKICAGPRTASIFSSKCNMVRSKGSTTTRRRGSTGWTRRPAKSSAGRPISRARLECMRSLPMAACLRPASLAPRLRRISSPRFRRHFPNWLACRARTRVASAQHSQRIAFVHSALEEPTEVYFADSSDTLRSARPITSFNKLFTERDLPKAKPYRWTADDGTTIEGMLMYPPGKFEAKHLPMFVFPHGGPDDADGNHFEADWYVWDRLAATQGWLVFEPNYRGSTGYGDKFLAGIVPEIVSRPGKDILEGVDALVKDGIADPDHLAVGGYSYGGYMTNWLITQTTRFKAAVTGAGAVENVANWGNDDTSFDDIYFLGGFPWEVPQRYQDEAAIFQMNKVRTPTHIVAGADDIRVAVAEAYLLDHALHALGVPSTLLIFPGEGHELDKNPWHGKIKVREELKWLEKYGGVGAAH